MSLPLDPQTLPIAATGFPAPIERHWDTLCRNSLGQLVDGNGVVVAVEAGAVTGDGNARFKTSVRVGSGTNAGLDGLDGAILANGAQAQIAFAARDVPANVGLWYYSGGKLRLFRGGDLWQVDETTGLIAQDALTALTAGTNITLGLAGWVAAGSRLVKPTGHVYAHIILTATGAVALGAVVATLAAGHRPPSSLPLAGTKVSGGVFTPIMLFINGSGQVTLETATLANGDAILCTALFMTS